MAVIAPISGMAVLRMVWKANTQAEVQEGEEVRAGVPVVDVVNPKAMRVRSRVSQADINDLAVDQAVKIGLDAYPELSFDGRIAQISPVGMVSTMSPKARVFVVLIDVNGSHPNLMPDLTASLDVTLSRLPGALVVPRDAVGTDGKSAFVRVKTGTSYRQQPVTVGATSALDVVLTSGINEGAVVARNLATLFNAGPAGPASSGSKQDGTPPGTQQ
jgi:HlyD family secretion protein